MHILYFCATAAQVSQPQTFWDTNKVMLTAIITWLVGLCGTWFSRYHISPNIWYLQALRVALGAVFDAIHPKEFKKLAASAREDQLQRKDEQKEQESP